MSTVQQTIEVDVPVSTAYNQWTQFESFPEFMEGVDHVDQVTDTLTHWKTSVGGIKREFDAEIVEQRPDRVVAWQSVDGPRQAGTVSFQPSGSGGTQVTVEMDFDPEGIVEQAGDKLGIVERRVQSDLERFKEFIESRGRETGAWRGEVSHGRSTSEPGITGNGTGTGSEWQGRSTLPPEDTGKPPL